MEKLDLLYPFTPAGGKEITSLPVRRPKVRDIKASKRFGSSAEDQEIGLFSVLCGLTAEDIEEMDAADYGALQDSFRAMVNQRKKPVANDGAAGEVVRLPAQ
jgi:hypothetical protein